jgi:hypothetical protein
MSNTKRGSKGPGHEYWGRRTWGKGKWLSDPGRFSKKQTAKKERRENKKISKDES